MTDLCPASLESENDYLKAQLREAIRLVLDLPHPQPLRKLNKLIESRRTFLAIHSDIVAELKKGETA